MSVALGEAGWPGKPYAEYRAFLAALDGDAAELPEDLNDFWRYFDRVVENELENTEATRVILYRLFDHLPAPALLDGAPTLWAAGRAGAGPLLGAITVASLPEPFRRRAGLPEMPGASTLMQGAYLAAGLARFLPQGWINAESIIEALSLAPDSDDPRARTVNALRARMKRASALLRLLTPLGGDPGPGSAPSPATGEGQRSAEEFFRQVLDQTGDGHLTWPDLDAMARELATRLDLDEPQETRSTTPSPPGGASSSLPSTPTATAASAPANTPPPFPPSPDPHSSASPKYSSTPPTETAAEPSTPTSTSSYSAPDSTATSPPPTAPTAEAPSWATSSPSCRAAERTPHTTPSSPTSDTCCGTDLRNVTPSFPTGNRAARSAHGSPTMGSQPDRTSQLIAHGNCNSHDAHQGHVSGNGSGGPLTGLRRAWSG